MAEQSLLHEEHVHSDWVDYNGHMNDAEYAKVFSLAANGFIDYIGLNADGREKYAYTVFTLETHLCYLKEAHENEKLLTGVQLLDSDAKRLHLFFIMKNSEGDVLATSEQMLMGMDSASGRPAPFPTAVAAVIEKVQSLHSQLEIPPQTGRKIGIRR